MAGSHPVPAALRLLQSKDWQEGELVFRIPADRLYRLGIAAGDDLAAVYATDFRAD